MQLSQYKNPLFDAIFKSENYIVVIVDLDYRIVDTNNIFPGQKREDLVGKKLSDILNDPEQLKVNYEAFNKVIETKKEQQFKTHLTLGEHTVHYKVSMNGIYENDELIGFVSISQDITNEEVYKAEIAEHEEFYDKVVDKSNSLIFRFDNKGNIKFANPYALEVLQFKKEELIGKYVHDTFVPDVDSEGNNTKNLFSLVVKRPSKYGKVENEIQKKDGTRLWVSWINYPQYSDKGELKELISVGIDITNERKQKKQLDQQHTILNQIREAIIITDLEGNIEFANQYACNLYEITYDQLIGSNVSRLYPEYVKKDFNIEAMAQLTLEEGQYRSEVEHVTANGKKLYIDLSLSIIKDQNNGRINILGLALDITSKKIIEMHRNKLVQIVDSAEDIIGIADLNGSVSYVNSYAKNLLKIQENKDYKFFEYIAPENHEILEMEIMPSVNKTGRWRGENKFITSDGEIIDVLFDLFYLYDDHNNPIALATVSKNISHLKKQQKELKRSERALKDAQSIGKVGSWEYDLITDELFWSDELFNLFEIDKKTTPSFELFLKAVDADDRQKVKDMYSNHLESDVEYDVEHRIVTANKKVKYLRERGLTERDKNGNPIRTIGTAQDITSLKKVEYQLEELVKERTLELEKTISKLNESEEKHRNLIESISMGIGIAVEGKIVFANPAMVEMFGYPSAEEIMQYSIFELVAEKDKTQLIKRHQLVQQGVEVPDTIEITLKKKNGKEFIAQVSIQDVIYGNQKGRQASIVDITELINTQNKLKQASKAKDEFLSVISHEIRTPLNSIIGMGKFLKDRLNTRDQMDLIDHLNSSSSYLESLISDILDYSKIESNNIDIIYERVDLQSLIQEVYNLHKSSAEAKGLRFELSYDFDSIPSSVELDPVRLRQILNNLINNAIKYTNQGIVSIDICTDDTASEKFLQFAIKDTGIGIHHSEVDTVFNLFEQSKLNKDQGRTGTGLGLAIVRRLTELMRGEITLESKLEEGSTFTLKIPLIVSSSKTNWVSQSLGIKPSFENKFNVLCVEDVAHNRFLMETYFKDISLEYVMVNNGTQAINTIKNNTFDIILMDIQMPGINGLEVTSIIRQQFNEKELPIFGVTADNSASVKNAAAKAGMNELITKPISFDRMSILLAQYLLDDPNQDFNFTYLKNLFSNNKEGLQEFYEIMMLDLTNCLENTRNAYAEGDIQTIKKEIHKLSSIKIYFPNQDFHDNLIDLDNIKTFENYKNANIHSSLLDLMNKIILNIKKNQNI